ncbi:unnamed protein product [Urochloa decumbens]|uniref:Uncharacterized protein n=1 Tax=Urochloa decumbens TaxID=240449 RepID=A0ABC8Z6Z7_9POAL
METSLLRATAALLPSARARRLGSGRLPLAVLPGHDAVVLAGRRVGTGRGGMLTAALKLKAPSRLVKTACAKPGSDDAMADVEEIDFDVVKGIDRMYKDLDEKLEKVPGLLYLPPPPEAPLSEEEKATQNKLKEISEKSILLLADSMSCLRPSLLRSLYPRVHVAQFTLARVAAAARDGRANPAMAVLVVDTLEYVRRMVSSACQTPLPLRDLKILRFSFALGPLYGLENNTIDKNFEAAWIAVLENLLNSVKDDIFSMVAGVEQDIFTMIAESST